MKIDDPINFGKFKHLSIRQVFVGCNSLSYSILKDYLNHNLNSPSFILNLSSAELELIDKLKISVSDGYFLIANGQKNLDYSNSLTALFRNKDTVAERKKGFIPINTFIYEGASGQSSLRKLQISGAPEYIEWAIKNVSDFYINLSDIDALHNLLFHKYIGLSVRKTEDTIYSFSPLYYSSKYIFDEDTLKINASKTTLNDDDGSFFKPVYKAGEVRSFENYSNSYAQGVEDWSDEEIDNAFGGEPDAYWNID